MDADKLSFSDVYSKAVTDVAEHIVKIHAAVTAQGGVIDQRALQEEIDRLVGQIAQRGQIPVETVTSDVNLVREIIETNGDNGRVLH